MKRNKNQTIFGIAFSSAVIVLAGFLFLFSSSQAAINKNLNYQGLLADSSGTPVADGSYTLHLNIYALAGGGVSLWSADQSVSTVNGIFSTMLDVSTLDFDGSVFYLGVAVGTDPEMTPRKEIGSVPQAINANNVIGDGLIDVTGNINTAGVYQIDGTNALAIDSVLFNTFAGEGAGNANTTGSKNSFFGYRSGYSNTTGSSNFFGGWKAGELMTSGSYNVAIGDWALSENIAGNYNTAIGFDTLWGASGNGNVALGDYALSSSNNTGDYNIAVSESLLSNTAGSYNIAMGQNSLGWNENGSDNVALGKGSLERNVSGNGSVAIGRDAGAYSTVGGQVFIGYQAGYSNTTGANNFFGGYQAGYNNSTGSQNTFIGTQIAFEAASTGSSNTAIGYMAAYGGISGSNNILVGNYAGAEVISGGYNIGVGANSLGGWENGIAVSGTYNTALGNQALGQLTTGNNNVAVGASAGLSDTTGYSNTFVGVSSGENTATGSGNVFLGYQAGYNETGSNKLYIENSNSATPLVYGEFDNDILQINGQLKAVATEADGATAVASIINTSSAWITAGAKLLSIQNQNTEKFAVAYDGTLDTTLGSGTVVSDANGILTVSSDERLKDVSGYYTSGLDAILNINPIQYHWNEQSGLDHENLYTGFSAQNVQEFIPEAVGVDSRGYLTLSDRPILAATINAIREQQGMISGLDLKTAKNVTTLEELILSIDTRFGSVGKMLGDQGEAMEDQTAEVEAQGKLIAGQESRISSLEATALTLEDQVAELRMKLNTETNLAQIDLNAQDTAFIKLLLGVERVASPEDVDILGKLSAKLLSTGGIEIAISDPEAATIGTVTIVSADGTNDGKSAVVKTKAVAKDSKIFATPNKPVKVGVTKVSDGESFTIETDEAVLEPLKVDWWIVETN